MLFMNSLKYSFFSNFFVRIIKTSVEYMVFFTIEGTVNSMGKRLKSSAVKMMSPGTTMMKPWKNTNSTCIYEL